jgi:hypothetical protein
VTIETRKHPPWIEPETNKFNTITEPTPVLSCFSGKGKIE